MKRVVPSLSVALVAIWSSFSPDALAAIKYVAASGDNSNGDSWGTAYTSLAAAFTPAGASHEFWVKQGKYNTPTTATSLTMEAGESIYGGFVGNETARSARNWVANITTISGDSTGDDVSDMSGSAPLLVTTGTQSGYVNIDGFTFRQGKMTASYGGAIRKSNAVAGFNVRNTIFKQNVAAFGGAVGIACNNGFAQTLENCLFHDNEAMGGLHGGAIYARRGDATGGGINIINCTFMNNRAWWSSSSTDASAGDDIGSVPIANGYTIKNSILWSGTQPMVENLAAAITYSDIRTQAGTAYPGSGNVYATPNFVDEVGKNFRLTGANASLLNVSGMAGYPATDLDNVSRPQGADADMGAYEKVASATATLTVNDSPNGGAFTVDVFRGSAYNGNTTDFTLTPLDQGPLSMTAVTPKAITATSRYAFEKWNDGSMDYTDNPCNGGAYNLDGNKTFTLTYKTQYKHTASAPGGGGTAQVDGGAESWKDSGATVTFVAVADSGQDFEKWTINGVEYVGAGNETVVLNGAIEAKDGTASFVPEAGSCSVTITAGARTFTVDGSAYSPNPQAIPYLTPIDLLTTTPQGDANTQYRFSQWFDGAFTHGTPNWDNWEVPESPDATITLTFNTFHKLTLSASADGTITADPDNSGDSMWYAANASVELTPVGNPGKVFVAWGGDASGSTAPLNISMTAPKTISATYKTVYFVDDSATGNNDGTSWANAYQTLPAALNAQASGQEFWIAAGTYSPVDGATAMTLQTGDILYGGFAGNEAYLADRDWSANETRVSGDFDGDGDSDMSTAPLMVNLSGENTTATLDGLVLEWGNNTTGQGASANIVGGALGMRSGSGSYAGGYIARHCIFRDNSSVVGAIYVNYSLFSAENCLFVRNTATGPAVQRVAGAISVRRDPQDWSLVNCTFADNDGVAAYAGSAYDVAFYRGGFATNCIFRYATSGSYAVVGDGAVNSAMTFVKCNGYIDPTGMTLTDCVNVQPVYRSATDYQLAEAGNASLVNNGAPASLSDDLRGAPRPISTTDIGAYEQSEFFDVTMSSSPAGRDVLVNDTPYTVATPTAVRAEGTVRLSAESPQLDGLGTTRYLFTSWTRTDPAGFSTGVKDYSFVLSQAMSWTANFATQYKASATTLPVSGAGTVTVTADAVGGWAYAGNSVTFDPTAVPGSGYSFDHWEGDASGNADPLTINNVSGPLAVVAVFVCSDASVTVQTVPAGLAYTADGDAQTSAKAYCWTVGAPTRTIVTTDNQDIIAGASQARFLQWSDGVGTWSGAGNLSVTYTPAAGSRTMEATFATWYKLTVTAPTGGSFGYAPALPGDTYYVSGQSVTVTATPDAGWLFAGWSGTATAGATINGNEITFTMSAAKTLAASFTRIWRVDADSVSGSPDGLSWATAYPTLSAALTAASAGSEFWVAEGTYKPVDATTTMQLEAGDAIYGGFAGGESARSSRNWATHAVIVSGNLDGLDNDSEMTTAPLMRAPATGTATVDGLILERGNNTATPVSGGAIGLDRGAAQGGILANHCIFRYNSAAEGGVFVNNYGSSVFQNCLFHNNTTTTTGGTLWNRRGTVTVTHCTFADNTGPGAGVDLFSSADSTKPNLVLRNSIMRSGVQGVNIADTGSTINYCNIVGLALITGANYTGGNNVDDSAPTFAGGTDYRLRSTSAMINYAGAPTYVTDDLRGVSRSSPDLGAYEGATYQLVVTVVGNGSVTPPSANGSWYEVGEQVELTAVDGTEAFQAWSGDLSGAVPTSTLTIDATPAVTATFSSALEPTTIIRFQ